jgi:hypothetical protein
VWRRMREPEAGARKPVLPTRTGLRWPPDTRPRTRMPVNRPTRLARAIPRPQSRRTIRRRHRRRRNPPRLRVGHRRRSNSTARMRSTPGCRLAADRRSGLLLRRPRRRKLLTRRKLPQQLCPRDRRPEQQRRPGPLRRLRRRSRPLRRPTPQWRRPRCRPRRMRCRKIWQPRSCRRMRPLDPRLRTARRSRRELAPHRPRTRPPPPPRRP